MSEPLRRPYQPVEELDDRILDPRFRRSTAAAGGGRYFFNGLLRDFRRGASPKTRR